MPPVPMEPVSELCTNCPHCGYAVAGLPIPLCPECGLAFNPNEPARTLHLRMRGLVWPLAAIALVAFQIAFYFSAARMGAAEPFRDMREYIISIFYFAAILTAFITLPIAMIAAFAWTRSVPTRARIATARSLALYTASMLPPVIASGFSVAFIYARLAGFDLIYGTKPSWINSWVLDLLGNPLAMLSGCAIAIWLVATWWRHPPTHA